MNVKSRASKTIVTPASGQHIAAAQAMETPDEPEDNSHELADLLDGFDRGIASFDIEPGHGDVDLLDGGGDRDARHSVDFSASDAFGAAAWLADPVADGRGWTNDRADDPLGDEDSGVGPLGGDSESVVSALRYAATESGRQDRRFRRVSRAKIDEQLLDFFPEDSDEYFVALAVRDTITAALLDRDAWSYEWIFGVDGIAASDLPARSAVLALFEARDLVFQTRVQYQMWLNGLVYEMRFPVPSLQRRFMMRLNGILSETGFVGRFPQATTLLETVWRNPGADEARLWELSLAAEPEDNTYDSDVHSLFLSFFSEDYLISRNLVTGGWHFTGTNPRRMAEDTRLARPGLSGASIHRGWSQWW